MPDWGESGLRRLGERAISAGTSIMPGRLYRLMQASVARKMTGGRDGEEKHEIRRVISTYGERRKAIPHGARNKEWVGTLPAMFVLMRRRFITLLCSLGLGLLTSCGGQGAGDANGPLASTGGAGSSGAAHSSAGSSDKAGMGGSGGGSTGTAGSPPGCATGVLGSDTVCIAARDAWAWATSAAGGNSAPGTAGAGGEEDGMGGAAGEVNLPEGCPPTGTIRSHLSTKYTTTYDGGTLMGDQCCYTSFQPCG